MATGMQCKGYQHEVTSLKPKKKDASTLMPRVHHVTSLLKRWPMGTHQGAVWHKHPDYYLDKLTFRFTSRLRKKGCCDLESFPVSRFCDREELWLHSLAGPEDLFRSSGQSSALAYVACIARFRMRTRL